MNYSDIVNKLRNNERISCSEVNGIQLIMLLQDGEIKNIRMGDDYSVYEVNFVPTKYDEYTLYHELNEQNCFDFNAAANFIKGVVKSYKEGIRTFIKFEDEYFEIILDLLETAE